MRRLALGVGVLVVIAACGSSFSGSDQGSGDDGGADGTAGSANDGGDPLTTGGEGGASKDAGPGGGGPQPGAEGGAPLDGVFVSAKSGHDDTGDGTLAKPLQTLGKAITRAKNIGKSVIACNETYNEAITVGDGVSVYGNYDCSNAKAWIIAATNAILLSPTSPAVTATGISKGTTLGHIDITVPSAVAAQINSIGVVATSSHGLELANLKITTGDALTGKDGTNPTQLVNDVGIDGTTPTAGVNTCGGAAGHNGGTGGVGGNYTETCTNSSPKLPKHVMILGSKAGSAGSVGSGGDGASNQVGTFALPSGYVSGDGKNGGDGSAGAGAHGADGSNFDSIDDSGNIGPAMNPKYVCVCSGNTFVGSCNVNMVTGSGQTQSLTMGTGGGGGGCPALAGTAGTGGGASIGIVSLVDALTLTTVSIKTGNGGDGGKGTFGTLPTAGGVGGMGTPATGGTYSGVSGSGAGGPSACIAFNVAPRLTMGVTEGSYTMGTGGLAVAALTSGDGRMIPASGAGGSAYKLLVP